MTIPLDALKAALKVTGNPLVVSPTGTRGQSFQLSTARPGARVIGITNTAADAQAIALLWRWGMALVEDLEKTIAIAKHYKNLASRGGEAPSTAQYADSPMLSAAPIPAQGTSSAPRRGGMRRR